MYYLYHVNELNYIEMRDGMTFGRNNGTKSFPDDDKMSGEHCRFIISGDEVYVEDLGSKNKTIIDRLLLNPNKPTQINLLAVLELGQQRFILTDHNLTLQEINNILAEQQRPAVTKIDGAKLIQERNDRITQERNYKLSLELELLHESHQKLNEQLIDKQFKLADAKKDIIKLVEDTELKLKRLDDEKASILNSVVGKEDQLQFIFKMLTSDTETLVAQLEKINEEIEEKKKKIIT